ncbi:MAG: alpha amylase C-terminal domain-containing protein, partial [Lachnospiraceae bacterium]|nr:alpha amylase C-terminal domain-containing protein [Lachnospiraceae bacterium]
IDYNRQDGEWVQNRYGGKENLDAIEFLQTLNKAVFERFPGIMMIAEESTAWPSVTKPVHDGGLGFNFKWNMGWMNDMLTYMAMDPYFRGSNHNLLTFSMMYAFSENYILPLSHDEVVHGKRSLLDKMYGTYEQKFKSLKLLYLYMYSHPGKKLLFMGGELGQFVEWRFAEELDWQLLDYDSHKGIFEFTKDLNAFYKSHKSLNENDSDWNGFEWINEKDGERSVLSFKRTSRSGREKTICVFNFAARDYTGYEVGVKSPGEYAVVLDTEDKAYNGKGKRKKVYKAKAVKNKPYKYAIYIDLPELSGMYIMKAPKKSEKSGTKK